MTQRTPNVPTDTTMARSARRRIVQLLGVAPLAGCTMAPADAVANSEPGAPKKTPAETAGPFYPPDWAGDVDGNLLRIDLSDGATRAKGAEHTYAQGTALQLRGQVLRADGTPAANARVAIWQADAKGRYRHPDDTGNKPAADGFQGYGQVLTDAQGRYQFSTIKPIGYAGRPPHVHFRIEDGTTELTTQMYFEGENKERGLLARFGGWAEDRTLLTVATTQDKNGGVLSATFDIFL